jgi:antitoxin ParD1/3/4
MNIALKPSLARFVQNEVRAGRFDSASDAVNAAVARLQAEKQFTPRQLGRLRKAIDIGLAEADRGEFVDFTAEDVIRERRAARSATRKKGG